MNKPSTFNRASETQAVLDCVSERGQKESEAQMKVGIDEVQ
jgi:hypothetical protein